jgi:hypothetical protein
MHGKVASRKCKIWMLLKLVHPIIYILLPSVKISGEMKLERKVPAERTVGVENKQKAMFSG